MTRPSTPLILISAALCAAIGCDLDDIASPTVEGPEEDAPLFPVEVHQPLSLTAIRTGETDALGRPIGIDCMSCHSLREEHDLPWNANELDELEQVHQGMFYRHGWLSCSACHDPAQADRLRLADGTILEMTDAMRLCAQCHGPQARDYEQRSHGGMRGYWDRRRGPAIRNHCVDCHDPHDPRFPTVLPAPPTQDRFLTTAGGH